MMKKTNQEKAHDGKDWTGAIYYLKNFLVFVAVYLVLTSLSNIFSFWQSGYTVRLTHGSDTVFLFSASFSKTFSAMWALLAASIYALVVIKSEVRETHDDYSPTLTEYDVRLPIAFGMILNAMYLFRWEHLAFWSAIEQSMVLALAVYTLFLFFSSLQRISFDSLDDD